MKTRLALLAIALSLGACHRERIDAQGCRAILAKAPAMQHDYESFEDAARESRWLFALATLSAAINKSLADPAVFKRLQDAGVDPTPGGTPEKLADFIKAELAKWAPIIQASGAQVD